MEQQIHFCTTADKVRIAYATVGSGPPLVKAANWLQETDARSYNSLAKEMVMATEHESMMGILKLYELRSEATMRRAREWFATGFNPESAQDVLNVLVGKHSADFRMVASYWDMACAFVVFGAINDEMFNAINTEHVFVYAKLQPFLDELRAVPGVPPYLYMKHLEPVVLRLPDAPDRVAAMRRYVKSRRETGAETKVETEA